MDAVVRLRINKRTGEIEFFQVDAERDGRSAAEHDRLHDELAAEIGGVLDLFPRVDELTHGSAGASAAVAGQPPGPGGTGSTIDSPGVKKLILTDEPERRAVERPRAEADS